jgi:hypothetical protein
MESRHGIETWTRAVITDKSGSRKANAARQFIRMLTPSSSTWPNIRRT